MLALATLALITCRGGGGEPDLPLEVAYAGCRAVRAGPVCAVSRTTGRLVLWVRTAPDAEVRFVVGDRPLTPSGATPVHGGVRYELPIAEVGTLGVQARRGNRLAGWRLELDDRPRPAWEVTFDAQLSEGASHDALQQVLETALVGASAFEHGRILSKLARIPAAGDLPTRKARLRRAVAEHWRHGRLSGAVDDSTYLVWLHLYDDWRLTEARAVLTQMPSELPELPAEALYYLDYYRGLVGVYDGDVRTALRALAAAARRAERLGLDREWVIAEELMARTLRRVGAHRAANGRFEALASRADTHLEPCERPGLVNSLAWDRLVARELGQPAGDPVPELRRALAAYRGEPCRSPVEAANVGINLALAHLQNDDLDAARTQLAAARAETEAPRLHHLVWWHDLEARIALAEGRPGRARALFDELEQLARSARSLEAQWRARVGQARARVAEGDLVGATDFLGAAEAVLDAESRRLPVHHDAALFAAPREPATQLQVDLLLALDRAGEALGAIRRSRSRAPRALELASRLAALDPSARARWDDLIAAYRTRRGSMDAAAADDWRRPLDAQAQRAQAREEEREALEGLIDRAYALLDAESPTHRLAPAGARELLLAFYPLSDAWVAFAHDEHGTRHHRLAGVAEDGGVDLDQLAARLLAPFADTIVTARRLRLLPAGALRRVDLHVVEVGGEPLFEHAPVVYGYDLPRRADVATLVTRRALVVADPTDDLPAARAEGRAVAERLRDAGWRVELLLGADASADAVRRELARADLLHYAGHGHFDEGVQARALPLAAGTRLTIGDVLAMARVPRQVVLLGCETARSDTTAPAESALGLAQAFLTAGTNEVLASVRPLDDRFAARLAEVFYLAIDEQGDTALALRSALRTLRDERPGDDWRGVRLLVR